MNVFNVVTDLDTKEKLSDLLKTLDYIDSFIFMSSECHDRQNDRDERFSAYDLVVGHVPKVKAEIIVDEKYSKDLLNVLQSLPYLKNKARVYILTIDQHYYF
jgi:nitrogen regulatory protein PII